MILTVNNDHKNTESGIRNVFKSRFDRSEVGKHRNPSIGIEAIRSMYFVSSFFYFFIICYLIIIFQINS